MARISAGVREDRDAGSRSDDTETRFTPTTLAAVLQSLVAVIRQRNADRPDGSYTTHLFESGEAKIRKKLGEEAVEILLAADRGELVSESADFLYHLLVLYEATGISLDDIARELQSRE